MSAQPKPKWKPGRPAHLVPVQGGGLKVYPLIRAAWMDQVEEARAILKADPAQINVQDPYAGLTALHIAVFRGNVEMVELLVRFPRCDLDREDNFGRVPADLLLYTMSHPVTALLLQESRR